MVAGKTAYSITAASAVGITVTYGFTFSSAPTLLLSVKSSSNVDMLAYVNGSVGTTSSPVRVEQPDGTTITHSGDVHWVAIGPG